MKSIDEDDMKNLFVCYACIGDAYLKAEIKSEGKQHQCMICKKRRRTTPFTVLKAPVAGCS